LLLMNSFATDRKTTEHLAGLHLDFPVRSFTQFISLRLTPDGELFRDQSGRPSLNAPGHGDLAPALAASGELDRLQAEGVSWLFVSNVDNLGAMLDPLIIGLHIDKGRSLSVEIVESDPKDRGGFAAQVDGKGTIVESFRLPQGSGPDIRRFLNTNTFVFDLNSLVDAPELSWFAVQREVDGQSVIQFERLLGQLADFLEVNWIVVPREGETSRFIPIKTPRDLELKTDLLRSVLAVRGGVGSG
jgi:UTP--glucose-1-phosphate uridylyltransferase